MTTLRWGSATDVGLVRTNNEDNLLVASPLFAVADGMGGANAGEVASQTAVDTLGATFTGGTAQDLVDAVRAANRAVWEQARGDNELQGMGTTLTAIALVEDNGEERLAVANVGDSRAYLFDNGDIERLTDDHSVAEELMRRGEVTAEEAAIHPSRHKLTRVLGITPEIEVDIWEIVPYEGQRLVLCSDGLSNEVSDAQIASVLRRLADPEDATRELVSLAKANGGRDNITVVVIDVADDDDRPERASAAVADTATRRATMAGREEHEPHDDDDVDRWLATHGSSEDHGRGEHGYEPPHRRMSVRGLAFVFVVLLLLGGAVVLYATYARAGHSVRMDADGSLEIVSGRDVPGFSADVDATGRQVDPDTLNGSYRTRLLNGEITCDSRREAETYTEQLEEASAVALAGGVTASLRQEGPCRPPAVPDVEPTTTTSTSTTSPAAPATSAP